MTRKFSRTTRKRREHKCVDQTRIRNEASSPVARVESRDSTRDEGCTYQYVGRGRRSVPGRKRYLRTDVRVRKSYVRGRSAARFRRPRGRFWNREHSIFLLQREGVNCVWIEGVCESSCIANTSNALSEACVVELNTIGSCDSHRGVRAFEDSR